MNANVALSDLASCGTRQIRAKLLRRVHRLLMVLLHKHIMPMSVAIFKPLPHFHQLVGLYPNVSLNPQTAELKCILMYSPSYSCIGFTSYRFNLFSPLKSSVARIKNSALGYHHASSVHIR